MTTTTIQPQLKTLYIHDLVLEVTRRCNMSCEHCMRGDAENLDMTENIIDTVLAQADQIDTVTFSGGEPSLNLPIIRYFFQKARELGKEPSAFYLVTNGKNRELQLELATLLLDEYDRIECPDMCGVSLSIDRFHNTDEQSTIIKGLAFYRDDKDRSQEESDFWVQYAGRAEDNGIGRINDWRPSRYELEVDVEDGTMSVEMVYVSANGNLHYDCDLDYRTIDESTAGHVSNLREMLRNAAFCHQN